MSQSANRPRVLVVEDETIFFKITVSTINILGFDCEGAQNGVEALAKLESSAIT